MQDLVIVRYGTEIQKGKCTFARRDIPKGARIFHEKPILQSNGYLDAYDIYTQFLGLNPQSRNAILGLSCRPTRQSYYRSRINKSDLNCIFSLCDKQFNGGVTPTKEEAAKVLAIFDDNQVHLQYRTRAELALRIARINHSCVPNVCVAWNPKLARYTVHALKDIKKDEEILYCYVFEPEPREVRQEALNRWGIDCKCWACDFDLVGKEEQKQQSIMNDTTRPKPRRRSTGELNKLWYEPKTPLASENRRWEWKRKNESMNKTNEDREILGRASSYLTMINYFMGGEGEPDQMLEERARLWKCVIRELENGDDERERNDVEAANAYAEAMEFARVCYGEDSEEIAPMLAYVRNEGPSLRELSQRL